MPSASSILQQLGAIANDGFAVAVGWHLVIAVAGASLLIGWRPRKRVAAALLALPVGSAATSAIISANPFNGIALGALFVALLTLAIRMEGAPIERVPSWALVLGLVMIAYAWVYPHFLDGRGVLAYLYGAPVGLVPCPTLSLVIGFGLVAGGFASRSWMITVAVAGAFYGLFGWLRLGVAIDVVLAAGAMALVACAWSDARHGGSGVRRVASDP
jgi:hypothetical protein